MNDGLLLQLAEKLGIDTGQEVTIDVSLFAGETISDSCIAADDAVK